MEKALALLELVAGGCTSLNDLAKASRMPKSTTYRLASALVRHGYLRYGSSQYQLGYRLLELGEITKQQIHIPTVAKPYMEEISHATSEAVHLGELVDSNIVYLEKVDSKRGLQMMSRVGLKSPAQTTAMGKAIIAQLPREEWHMHFHDLPPKTANTITQVEGFLEELETVRKMGFAFDREENEMGICCVAAPIWNATGQVIAAVSLSGAVVYLPKERLDELAAEVVRCAKAISRELGGQHFAASTTSLSVLTHPE